MRKKVKCGFTLSEVLLVLSVIGVVAALTIPTLTQNIGKDQYAVALKKQFSTLSQAFMMIQADNGGSVTGGPFNGNNNTMLNAFAAKLNLLKKCYDGATGCWYNSKMLYLNGSVYMDNPNSSDPMENFGGANAVLADGAMIRFYDDGGDCTSNYGAAPINKTCGDVFVDVNGSSPPNKMGYDVYRFFVTLTGIAPYGNNDGTDCTIAGVTGMGCATKVLTEGKINY